MLGIEIIEVGIGLFLFFFIIATICSGLIEIWVKFTKLRSSHLKKSLASLLSDSDYKGLVKELYDHHLISSSLADKVGGTTYIDSQDFASALMDILGGLGESSLHRLLTEKINLIGNEGLKKKLLLISQSTVKQLGIMRMDTVGLFSENENGICVFLSSFPSDSLIHKAIIFRISEIDDASIKVHFMEMLNCEGKPSDELKQKLNLWFQDPNFTKVIFSLFCFASPDHQKYMALEKRIKEISNPKLKKRFLDLLYKSTDGLESMKLGLETWFNNSMYNVSAWYKQKMRYFVTFVSLIVVVSLNADTVRVASELWNDNELREASVNAANSYVAREEARVAKLPVGSEKSFGQLMDTLKVEIQMAEQMPVGWGSEVLPWEKKWPQKSNKGLWWMAKILGLLLTVGAVSMGATYWYKQLKSLMNLKFPNKKKT